MSDVQVTSRPRVLVIEDDDVSREALRKILRIAGFEVSCACNVEQAMAKLDGHQTIVLDLNLPDGEGTSVLAHARRHNPRIRIAVATASDHETDISNEAKRLKPDAFFRKPFRVSELIHWLRDESPEVTRQSS